MDTIKFGLFLSITASTLYTATTTAAQPLDYYSSAVVTWGLLMVFVCVSLPRSGV